MKPHPPYPESEPPKPPSQPPSQPQASRLWEFLMTAMWMTFAITMTILIGGIIVGGCYVDNKARLERMSPKTTGEAWNGSGPLSEALE